MSIAPFRATCLQMRSEIASPAPDRRAAWEIIRANLSRATSLIDAIFEDPATHDTRLVLLPEFVFQGPPRGETVAEWVAKACAAIPGDITAPLQDRARVHGIFIGGNHFEVDPEWPGRFFNTSFLIDPAGSVILRYRRIHTAQWPSPHDMMDAYLARYGIAGTFPVVDTDLGRIAMLPCGEISVPEAARVFMLRGAEVLLHPDNASASAVTNAAKIVRAYENMIYLVSSNVAGRPGFETAGGPEAGESRIIDHDGRILVESSDASEAHVSAIVDIEALRAARRELTMRNRILRTRFEIYRPIYADAVFYPANQFASQPMTSASATAPVADAALANLIHRGVAVTGSAVAETARPPQGGATRAEARA